MDLSPSQQPFRALLLRRPAVPTRNSYGSASTVGRMPLGWCAIHRDDPHDGPIHTRLARKAEADSLCIKVTKCCQTNIPEDSSMN